MSKYAVLIVLWALVDAGSARAQSRPVRMPPARLGGEAVARASAVSADPKRLYIGNDDHTDYMWSGDEAQYRAAFLAMLDYYMNQAEATAGNGPDARAKFNCDGSLWVWEYEHH